VVISKSYSTLALTQTLSPEERAFPFAAFFEFPAAGFAGLLFEEQELDDVFTLSWGRGKG